MDGRTLVNSLIYATAISLTWAGLGLPARADAAAGTAGDVLARHVDAVIPMRSRETLHGVIAGIDEQHDRITLRLTGQNTADFKVQDGLLFNAVRFGDQVEVTVETIDGAKTIVGLRSE
jgi:Cu/Ag efflux protein CusF